MSDEIDIITAHFVQPGNHILWAGEVRTAAKVQNLPASAAAPYPKTAIWFDDYPRVALVDSRAYLKGTP